MIDPVIRSPIPLLIWNPFIYNTYKVIFSSRAISREATLEAPNPKTEKATRSLPPAATAAGGGGHARPTKEAGKGGARWKPPYARRRGVTGAARVGSVSGGASSSESAGAWRRSNGRGGARREQRSAAA
jgi:hypothetical protein